MPVSVPKTLRAVNAFDDKSYEAVIDGLEDALRETVAIAASAAATAAMTVAAASASVPSSTALPWMPTRNPPDQPVEGDPDASRDCRGGSGGHSTPKCRAAGAARLVPGEEVSLTSKGSARDSPSRRPAVIASAAEDVAIQVACSLLAARLAWGEVKTGFVWFSAVLTIWRFQVGGGLPCDRGECCSVLSRRFNFGSSGYLPKKSDGRGFSDQATRANSD